MAEPKITRRKLTDYQPDPRNANQGTERGVYMLDKSIESVGPGRSLVASADDFIPIGNHAQQAFIDAGFIDVVEVETDGKTVIVHKRSDWKNIADPIVRKAALFDNRSSEVGLAWDAERILADLNSGVDLSALFHDWELDTLLEQIPDGDIDPRAHWRGMPEFEQEDLTAAFSIRVHFRTLEDLQSFAQTIEQSLTEHTKSIWFPKLERENLTDKAWISES